MEKKDIIEAYCKIRTIDQTIPDEVLDFMKQCAIERLDAKQRDLLTEVEDWSKPDGMVINVPDEFDSLVNSIGFQLRLYTISKRFSEAECVCRMAYVAHNFFHKYYNEHRSEILYTREILEIIVLDAAKYGFNYRDNSQHQGEVPKGNILQWLQWRLSEFYTIENEK